MTICTLAEVSARLENMIGNLESGNNRERYQYLEILAISILDSEFDNYEEGLLEEYLKVYLHMKRLELGIDETDLQ